MLRPSAVTLRWLSLPVLCGLLAGCAPDPLVPKTPFATLAQEPVRATRPYRMGPGDVLEIAFYRHPDLDREVVIRPDGRISLPAIGEIEAVGRTPAELSSVLTRSYKHELARPNITVIVASMAPRPVFVGGEVQRPGVLELTPELTLFSALTEAGGILIRAEETHIVLIRRNAAGEPIGQSFNIDPILNGVDPSGDIALQPYDIVHVPRSGIAKMNDIIRLYVTDNLPIHTVPWGVLF